MVSFVSKCATADGELIYRERRTIVSKLLGQNKESYSDIEDVESDDEAYTRQRHFKSDSDVLDWLNSAELGTDLGPVCEEPSEGSLHEPGKRDLPRLDDYKVFIESSESYRWLISRLWQHGQLSYEGRDTKSEIGNSLREKLRSQESGRKMSHRRPLSKVLAEFVLQWHPESLGEDQRQDHAFSTTLEEILCLTGSWHEAQAMTIADYMRQTWPATGEAVIDLFRQLMAISDDETCVCEYQRCFNPRQS
jgi:hypothetical protein